MLFHLVLTDNELSYDNHSEDFSIGYFYDRFDAEKVAEYYLNYVKGFSEFPCTYRIEEKEVSGNTDDENIKSIWIVQGWNENENFDETDIIESICFVKEADAVIEMQNMKEIFLRKEWCIQHWKIGQLEWQEGFCRWYNGEFLK